MKKFLVLGAIGLLGLSITTNSCNSASAKPETWVCLPCGLDCDTVQHKDSGTCPVCHMELVKKSTVVFKTIQPEDICAYIAAHPGVILLDVRTKLEYEEKADPNFGTIKNAINIPVQELDSTLATDNIINRYKEKPIIVYCSHSHRSPRASYMLTQHGFADITNMAGGMSVMMDSGCKK